MNHEIPAFVYARGINGLQIIRSLGRQNIPVYIIDKNSNDIAFTSRYAKHIQLFSAEDPEAVVKQLLELAGQFSTKPALIFASDYFLRLASNAYDQLSTKFRLQVPPAEAVETVSNKQMFAQFTEANNFPVPHTYVPKSLIEVEALTEHLEFPALLKPGKSFDWSNLPFKMVRVDNKTDLISQWKKLQNSCVDLLIQEMIEGDDDHHYSYYAYRTHDRGEVISICVKKIRIQPPHAGVGAFLQVVHDPEMEMVGRNILEKLEYTGIASVCFKKDARTGKPKIYEINGRLPLCHSVFQMCGMDLPYIMYRDMIGEPVAIPSRVKKEGKWSSLTLDIKAFTEYRRCGELGFWEWLASYRGTKMCAEFAWDDLGPFFYFSKWLANKGLVKMKKIVRIGY